MARFILKVSITLRRRVRNSPKAADIMWPSPTFRTLNAEPTTTTSGSTAHSSVAVGSGEQLTVWMCSICRNFNNPATIRKSGRDENVCQVCDSAKPDTA